MPAVCDRQSLVNTLRGLLGDLGLSRRAKATLSLGEYLAARPGSHAAPTGAPDPQPEGNR